MSKTIKQIADELGVSKQAVHQKRKSEALSTALQPFTTTVDGVVYISVDGEKLLKQAFLKQNEPQPSTSTVNEFTPVDGHVDGQEHPLYTILREQLATLNKQLDEKDSQINEKDSLIKQLQKDLETERQHSREQSDKFAELAKGAQQLHAGSIKQQLGAGEPAHGEEVAIDAEPVDSPAEEPAAQPAAPAEPGQRLSIFEKVRLMVKIFRGK